MGKVFGILTLVAALWIVAELTTKGMQGAFGGALAGASGSEVAAQPRPTSIPKRAGDKVEAAHHEAAERRDRMLGGN